MRLLTDERASNLETPTVSRGHTSEDVSRTKHTGGEPVSSAEVPRLLGGLRQRLRALEQRLRSLEQAQGPTLCSSESTGEPGSGGQEIAHEKVVRDEAVPLADETPWHQSRVHQLFPGATAAAGQLGRSETDDEAEEPAFFDAQELGNPAEAQRLLSILYRLGARRAGEESSETARHSAEQSHTRGASWAKKRSVPAFVQSQQGSNAGSAGRGGSLTGSVKGHAAATHSRSFRQHWDTPGSAGMLDSIGRAERQASYFHKKGSSLSAAGAEPIWEAEQAEIAARGPQTVSDEIKAGQQQGVPHNDGFHVPDAAPDIDWQRRRGHPAPAEFAHEDAEEMEEPYLQLLQAQSEELGASRDAERPKAVPVSEQRLLQAGIVGVPNSGKSTLTNALVGHKVRSTAFALEASSAERRAWSCLTVYIDVTVWGAWHGCAAWKCATFILNVLACVGQ